MRVRCEIEYTELENDDGREINGVVATCSRCGNTTESFGTEGRSIRRCLVLMREDCPEMENNYYWAEEADDV